MFDQPCVDVKRPYTVVELSDVRLSHDSLALHVQPLLDVERNWEYNIENLIPFPGPFEVAVSKRVGETVKESVE